jgi:ceramide glucosyltransferase
MIGWIVMVLAMAGSAYQLLAGRQVHALLVRPRATRTAAAPAVTILKPLHGGELGLDVALHSFLAQDYPGTVQVVFGVQNPADPAQVVVGSLRGAHPGRDVALVVDATQHGANRKISNVINMMRRAKHDIILLADSDIVVRPDYLREVVAALEAPGVGVVTCAYHGQPVRGIWSRLAAMGLSYQFLPSVAVGVGLGLAQPCMGSTIALRREALTRIGGFETFADLLADDYAIGAAVRAAGLRSLVAPVLVAHNCAEGGLAELVRHELRWARTIRGVDPAGFVGSGVTHAVPLALLGLILTGASVVSLAVLAFALICRLWLMREVDRIAGADGRGWWLSPLRDILSFAIFIGSFFVRAVDWRGAQFRVDAKGALRRI